MKDTQIRRIEQFCIRKYGENVIRCWITQRDAFRLGIYRLASRISNMKDLGYEIATEYVRVENADGSYSRVARYMILRTPDEVIHDVANV